MKYEDNDFCSEEEESEQPNYELENPFCKERSPIEFYNFQRNFKQNEIKCRCSNQDLVAGDDFCEQCNMYIY